MSNTNFTKGSASTEDDVRKWFSNDQGSNAASANDSLLYTLSSLLDSVKENRWSILILMVLGCAVGVFKAVSEKPIYQAKLTMSVEPNVYRASQQSMFDPYAFRFYETQYELLKSRSVAEKVVEKMDLVNKQSAHQLLTTQGFFTLLKAELAELVGIDIGLRDEVSLKPTVALSDADVTLRKKWLTNIVQGGVNVFGGEKTNLVTVTFNSTSPKFAAEIANSLVQAYIDMGQESQQNRSEQTSKWLSQRIVEIKESLNDSEELLQAFLVEEDMLESRRSNQIDTNELNVLNQEYLTARANHDELTKRYGQRHPKISGALAEMNAAKSRLNAKSKVLTSSRVKNFELSRLERDVEVNRELYEAFLAKFKESDISSSGSHVTSARIVDKALPPSSALYPNKKKIIFTWTFGGLLLGVLIAFIRDQLDATFKSGRMVEEKLGLPLLGVIQTMPVSEESTVERHYLQNNRSGFSEEINHIRTGITYSNVDKPPKVILVTSSVQSEGKTTMASNLAISYAQLGPTLLIDADLRRPRIKHIIKSDHNNGLVELVAGAANATECINIDKEVKNLHVLNSGTTPPNPLELLASERFSVILEKLKERYSHIIIDTAPVLPASDAIVLGQMCDALLMVVQSDRTTHHMARDAIKRLVSNKVDNITGLVLTQANLEKGKSYRYGGYYGYRSYAYTYSEDSS